ncbi:imidazole glycerol phosphate synthase subunit HisH [Desertibaculum subflavum]|uniref:imidazole glycerol phosphate synthase subunit HisH n=1 Tax=Desertibaculum subflavum TaxID=2268458 RepID=UPI000E66783F
MIGIVSCGIGNVQSVLNAFARLGHEAMAVEDPARLGEADRIVLPGVGAFPSCMRRLQESGFRAALDRDVKSGKPFLGVCVGMQLMAETGTEFGDMPGLGYIPGRVELIPKTSPDLRIPHIGWNDLRIARPTPLLAGLDTDSACYFVHSYALRCAEEQDVAAWTDYGSPVVAAVARGNVFGLQAHPEKSQLVGLRILDNFARLPC